MSSEVSIKASGLGKAYAIFDRPQDRLKQMLSGGRRTYYREFWALRDIDLEIYRGETVGIIGANGSGKSTLLQLICGNLAQTTGEISIRGRVAALLELGAGFNREFTGRENVFVNASIVGYDADEIAHKLEAIASFADIGEFMDHPVKTYSSGMFARLAFAVAINVDPDILIIDEALAVGDESFQRKCFARIGEIRDAGGTILFVSHSVNAIVELCDRAVLLHHGSRQFTGAPKRAVSWYQKLANAAPEHTGRIQQEIRDSESTDDDRIIPGDDVPYLRSQIARNDDGMANIETCDAAGEAGHTVEVQDTSVLEMPVFDPSLESRSIVSYEPNGARISNPRLTCAKNQIVNCLISGQRYRFCYDVAFDRDLHDARFYSLIKSVTGVELGGAVYPPIGTVGAVVRAGEQGVMEFEFACNLNSGTYFLNCGVGGDGNRSMHRIIDSLAFRVQPRGRVSSFGMIDFLYESAWAVSTTSIKK